MTHLEDLTAAIVKAVPEAGYQDPFNVVNPDARLPNENITLEDVLRALEGINEIGGARWWNVCSDGAICLGFRRHSQWTLGQPLHLQSPETLAFLHSLLV